VKAWAAVVALMAVVVARPIAVRAQRAADQRSARDRAPIDITGYWVSYVTENWRYRMVTPPKGEYRRIPSSRAALPIINAWDPAADARAGQQCKSYGAGNIMSVPGRLHITWQDAETLKIETDAGMQTRLLQFSPKTSATAGATARSWQGESTATWEPAAGGGGDLRVFTRNLNPGYLRKNGVPYSEQATVTENFDLAPLANGGQLLVVNTVIEDPIYLNGPYVISPHFKKEPDGSKWDPTPCSASW